MNNYCTGNIHSIYVCIRCGSRVYIDPIHNCITLKVTKKDEIVKSSCDIKPFRLS